MAGNSFDFAIRTYESNRLAGLNYTTIPITSAVDIPVFTEIESDPPKEVKIPSTNAYLVTSYYSNMTTSLSTLFQTLCLGSSFNRYMVMDFAWKLKMISDGNGAIKENSTVYIYTKLPSNQAVPNNIREICGRMSKVIISALDAPLSYEHSDAAALTIIKNLGFTKNSVLVSFKNVGVQDVSLGVVESDVVNWLSKSDIWNFLTTNEITIDQKTRVKYILGLSAMTYGAKGDYDPFGSHETSNTYILPSNSRAFANDKAHKTYCHITYEPWMPVILFSLLNLFLEFDV